MRSQSCLGLEPGQIPVPAGLFQNAIRFDGPTSILDRSMRSFTLRLNLAGRNSSPIFIRLSLLHAPHTKSHHRRTAPARTRSAAEKRRRLFLLLGPGACYLADKTVKVLKVSSLTLVQWVAEYERLKKLNEEILQGKVGSEPGKPPAKSARPRKKRLGPGRR